MKNKPVIIVGGGASGMAAAIVLAREGISVTLLEQNSKIGKKILVSGNGQCNITNRHITPERFYSQNPNFISEVLAGYPYEKIEQFFATIGLPLAEGKEGKVFPMSFQASSVVKLLEFEALRLGVDIVCDCKVMSIKNEERAFLLETSKGTETCSALLLASGSSAAPRLGGSASGMKLAESLGHSLIESHPSLVQLCSSEKWLKQASGAKVNGTAKLYANDILVAEKSGDILFADYGVSGLAILDVSREASLQLAQYARCRLSLDLLPQMSKEQLAQFLTERIQKGSQKSLVLWLTGVLHERLISIVLEQSGCKVKLERELDRKEIGKLVYTIKNLRLVIEKTKGFESAEVATGGVDTSEIESDTMASRRVSGLYLAGEILDVDGDRGGFNFHFAWLGGMRAAQAIIEKIKS